MSWRHILAVLAFLLSLLLLGGCFAVGTGVGRTPEQAAEQAHPPTNGGLRTYVVKPAPKGALVVYRDNGAASQAQNDITIGFSYVTPDWFGWVAHETGGMSGMPDTDRLALFTDSPEPPTNHTIIVGLTIDPNVDTAVVTFGTGQTLRDQLVNGLFGMVAEPKTPPCRLELWNAQGERIELIDFRDADSEHSVGRWAEHAQKECPQEDSQ